MSAHDATDNFFAPPTDANQDYLRLGAWFLGPKGENGEQLKRILGDVVDNHTQWRHDYFPEDPPYITDQVTSSFEYKNEMKKFAAELEDVMESLRNSNPFFSSRYKGHMNWDVSMLGLIGYFATSLYNPNNVATEGSPATTKLELEVGLQLAHMLGFTETEPAPWGHIVSCGSVANIESMWAARNIKYLLLGVRKYLNNNQQYWEACNETVTLANGSKKPFREITDDWELVNVPADSALDVIQRINQKGVVTWETLMSSDIQHEGLWNVAPVAAQGKVMVATTCHYSWKKACALLGIGQNNLLLLNVDRYGRVLVSHLRKQLEICLKNQTPVIQVVAIVGSTAEGAVDPVSDIVALRQEYRTRGLDFFLHIDAAWGGYFTTTIKSLVREPSLRPSPVVPGIDLSNYVVTQLQSMKSADSITVDPHKSGFIQYPAGSLCYRNGFIRNLLAFSAPVIYNGVNDPSIGIFGIEGSKPGAAVVATYLHHKVAGLDLHGHGRLLRQCHFTTKKIFALLATIADNNDPFKVGLYQGSVSEADKLLFKEALLLSNEEILSRPDLQQLLTQNGPDLLINGFVVNFSWPIMVPPERRKNNTDLDKVNQLIDYISNDLNNTSAVWNSHTIAKGRASRKKLFLIRNQLTPGHALVFEQFKQQLGIEVPNNNPAALKYLVNSNMDPWPTATGFLDVMKHELRQSILRGIGAVMEMPHLHGFVVGDAGDGTVEVYGNHLPVFSEPQHNYHLIVKLAFESAKVKEDILSHWNPKDPTKPIIVGNAQPSKLADLLQAEGPILMDVFVGLPSETGHLGQQKITIKDIFLNEHFDPADQKPLKAQYFLFGAKKTYMSHVITISPDYHHMVRVKVVSKDISDLRLELGVVVTLEDLAGGFSEKDPLTAGREYKASYIEEGQTKTCVIKVKSTLWFDTESLNSVAEDHHAGPTSIAAAPKSIPVSAPHPPSRVVFFDIGNTLGSVSLSSDDSVVFTPYQQTVPVLKRLKALGISLGLISNTPDGFSINSIGEVATYFDIPSLRIFSSEVKVSKPSHEIFQLAITRARNYLGVELSAKQCMFVGEDAEERESAHWVGMRVAPSVNVTVELAKGSSLGVYSITSMGEVAVPEGLVLEPFDRDNTSVVVLPENIAARLQNAHEGLSVVHLAKVDETVPGYRLSQPTPSSSCQRKPSFAYTVADGWVMAVKPKSTKKEGDTIPIVPLSTAVLRKSQTIVSFNDPLPKVSDEAIKLLTSVINAHRIQVYDDQLSKDLCNNRHVSSPQMRKVTLWLQKEFNDLGVTTTRHPFKLAAGDVHPPAAASLTLYNVIGEIKGESDKFFVVGAHFDSTAISTFGDSYDPTKDPAPGADDDGSGVAALLLIATAFMQLFKDHKPKYSIRFVLFNAEEQGLVGSSQYVRNLAELGQDSLVLGMFQLDTIGYNIKTKTFEVHSGCRSSDQALRDACDNLALRVKDAYDRLPPVLKLELYPNKLQDPAQGRSDHGSFHAISVPAVAISNDFFPFKSKPGETNPNYHKETDTVINASFATHVALVVAVTLLGLTQPEVEDGREGRLSKKSSETVVTLTGHQPNRPEDEVTFAGVDPETVVSSTAFARWVVPRETLDELAKSHRNSADRASIAAARKIHNNFVPSGGLSMHALAAHSQIGAAIAGPAQASIVVDDMNYETEPLPGTTVHFPLPKGTQDILLQNANWVLQNSTTVRDFYSQILNRNSIDGQGMTLLSSIRFGVNYLNAFWNGEQMVYGCPDSDQVLHDLAKCLDVTGHEMSHGMVQHTAGFLYYGQAGALNEHVADCFGLSINQWKLKRAEWGLGIGIFQDAQKPLRSFENPAAGSPPQPNHMKNYKKLPFSEDGDNGGVHYNSGIPNHAFYLVCKYLNKNSWEDPIQIWYRSLLLDASWGFSNDADLGKIQKITDLDGNTSIGRFTSFAQWAARTVKVAQKLYGDSSAALVQKAWTDVGVIV